MTLTLQPKIPPRTANRVACAFLKNWRTIIEQLAQNNSFQAQCGMVWASTHWQITPTNHMSMDGKCVVFKHENNSFVTRSRLQHGGRHCEELRKKQQPKNGPSKTNKDLNTVHETDQRFQPTRERIVREAGRRRVCPNHQRKDRRHEKSKTRNQQHHQRGNPKTPPRKNTPDQPQQLHLQHHLPILQDGNV